MLRFFYKGLSCTTCFTSTPCTLPCTTEQGTHPEAILISKQLIPYQTRGVTCCPGVSTPKNWSLANSSKTNHILYVGDAGRRPHAEGPLVSPCSSNSNGLEKMQVKSCVPKAPWRHQAWLAFACINSWTNLRILWLPIGWWAQDLNGCVRRLRRWRMSSGGSRMEAEALMGQR
jgi:hypothetical protein